LIGGASAANIQSKRASRAEALSITRLEREPLAVKAGARPMELVSIVF